MQEPLVLFPSEETKEKLAAKAEGLGMTQEEYFEYLLDNDNQEEDDEDEEDEDDEEQDEDTEDEDENDEEQDEEPENQFSEILAGITDVSDKDSIIKELKHQVIARENEVLNLTDEINEMSNYTRFNLIFNLVRGHTLKISNSDVEIVIRKKADFIQALVKNFHYSLDSEDFNVDNDEFEKMTEKAFKEDDEKDNDNE